MKQGKNENKIKWLKKIQFLLYGFIRVPIITLLLYKGLINKKIKNKTSLYMIVPVYIMGLVWTKKLWNRL